MRPVRLAVVPPVPALLPEYASLRDPVPALRKACADAGEWLVRNAPSEVRVIGAAGDLAERVARAVLEGVGSRAGVNTGEVPHPDAVMLVVNGSARRGEKAPGHLDERCFDFDHRLSAALKTGDLDAMATLDLALAEELLTSGLPYLARLAAHLSSWQTVEVLHDESPYGVQYWVVTAECVSS